MLDLNKEFHSSQPAKTYYNECCMQKIKCELMPSQVLSVPKAHSVSLPAKYAVAVMWEYHKSKAPCSNINPSTKKTPYPQCKRYRQLDKLVIILFFSNESRTLASLLDWSSKDFLRVAGEDIVFVLDQLLRGSILEALNCLCQSTAEDGRAMAWATIGVERICDSSVRRGAGLDRLICLGGITVIDGLVEDLVALRVFRVAVDA